MKTFFSIIFWVVVGGVFGTFIVFSFGSGAITTDSMEPTLTHGDWRFSVLDFHPEIGDIISFYCGKRCSDTHPFIQHRLTAIDSNGCMHIEGDNQPMAWDTKDYGCLMPDEIFVFAKSYPIDFLNN